MTRQFVGFAILLSLFCLACHAQAPQPTPVTASTLSPPVVFHGSDGRDHLVYELFVTNVDSKQRAVTLKSVTALSGGSRLAVFPADSLKSVRAKASLAPAQTDGDVIQPSSKALYWMWVDLPAGAAAPAEMEQEISVSVAGVDQTVTFRCCKQKVTGPGPVLASPLHGDCWVAGNGPSNTSDHRRALLTVDGRQLLAQRLAIDWVQCGASKKTHRIDGKRNEDYYAFGSEVYAVADGVVAATHDGIAENVPNEVPKPTLETVAGNFISLDIGGGLFAGYAHLQPGSLRVKVGDHVRRGQLIGLLGNTGNSTEPHLHFEVTDAPSIVIADGMPYRMESFELTGQTNDDMTAITPATHLLVPRALPLENEVVNLR